MKYRKKYQAGGGSGQAYGRNNAPKPPEPKPRFIDHVIDVGEFALNTTLTPFETITGTNFYDPQYSSDFMQDTSDISSAIIGAGTDIAGTMVAGPLYHAGKLGITKGSQALGLKDATHSDHNAWAEKTASTIGFVGDAAGVLAGGVAEKGGNIGRRKYQTMGNIGLNMPTLGGNMSTSTLGQNLFNIPQLSSPFNVSPSNFGDAGTWGQMDIPGGGTFSTTSNYARPFSTEKGNLYRGIEGGQHLTNEDISLLTSDVNAGYDASGNYQASITPNNYNMFNRFGDKFLKPFANQTVVGAQQYGDAMQGNVQTLFGKGQGNLQTRLGNLDSQSIGQTAGLASAAAGIYNTWKPGARTQSQLVGDAEDALEASNIATLGDQGWYGNNWRGAERGGNISEYKERNNMKDYIMKYYKGGHARPKMQNMGQMSPAFMQHAPESTMPFLQNLFGPQENSDTSKFGNLFAGIQNLFQPSNKMGPLASAKNITYRGNEVTQNKNMDEFKRLFTPNTVVGQDRTYDNSARQNNEGIGYDKAGILANLGKNHRLYKSMEKNLRTAEYGGTPKKYPHGGSHVDPNSQGPIEIEVEGGETIKTIDGQDNKFTGPSHDQGGIITKANDGDFVYPKGVWAKRHEKRTNRQADILAKLEEAGVDINGLV